VIIEKKQTDPRLYRAHWTFYASAREGFQTILRKPELRQKTILLPAYIGYSSREGSGVYDPVVQTKTKHVFYRFNNRLQIDHTELKQLIKDNPGQMLLLIDYFGFKDKNLESIKACAQKYRLTIIEDFAHAVLTFFQNPVIDFDYGLFSIHKMFPVETGGAVLTRARLSETPSDPRAFFDYDFQAISQKRIMNYQFLLKKFLALSPKYGIEIMYKTFQGSVPQTFPVLMKDRFMRDHFYFALNKAGYGVVSLYHTLIQPIDPRFKVEHNISSRILNFPVHQDVEFKALDGLYKKVLELLKKY
jgi:dTDP-4-amino-4,6-dideoxygalactose transaminase